MKILDFILCDDIRAEISNKHTLVGVYNDQFVVQAKSLKELKLPLAFRLAFYLRMDLEGASNIKIINFKFSGDSIEEFAGVFHLQSPPENGRPLVVVATGFMISIKAPGPINIEFDCKDSEGRFVTKVVPNSKLTVYFKEI